MRFVFQLLLGMVLFNAMLIYFSPFFPSNPNYQAVDITESDRFSNYLNLNIGSLLSGFFTAFITSFFITALIGFIFSGNLPIAQLLGASLVISVFVGLWNGLTSPITSILSSFPDVFPLYTIFTIALGVVLMFSVIEIFTGKGDETG